MLRKKWQIKGLIVLLASSLMMQNVTAIDIPFVSQMAQYIGERLSKASPDWWNKIDKGDKVAIVGLTVALVAVIIAIFQRPPSLLEQVQALTNEIKAATDTFPAQIDKERYVSLLLQYDQFAKRETQIKDTEKKVKAAIKEEQKDQDYNNALKELSQALDDFNGKLYKYRYRF